MHDVIVFFFDSLCFLRAAALTSYEWAWAVWKVKGALHPLYSWRSDFSLWEITASLMHPLMLYPRMGSVLAASSPNPPPPASGGAAVPGLTVPPGFGMPPVSSVLTPNEAASGQQPEAENPLPNPGAFDECHRKCKGKWRSHSLDTDKSYNRKLCRSRYEVPSQENMYLSETWLFFLICICVCVFVLQRCSLCRWRASG